MIFENWLFPEDRKSEIKDTGCSMCGQALVDANLEHINVIDCEKELWAADLSRALHEVPCTNCSVLGGYGASSLIVVPKKRLMLFYIPPECPVISRHRAVESLESLLTEDQKKKYEDFTRKIVLNKHGVKSLIELPINILPIANNAHDPSVERVSLCVKEAAVSFMDEVDRGIELLTNHEEIDDRWLPYFVSLNRFERTAYCKRAYKDVFDQFQKRDGKDYDKIHQALLDFLDLPNMNLRYEVEPSKILAEEIEAISTYDFERMSQFELYSRVNSLIAAGFYGKAFDLCEVVLSRLDESSFTAAHLSTLFQYGTLVDLTQEWKLGSPIQYYLIIIATITKRYGNIDDASVEERMLVSNAYQSIGKDFARRKMWLAYADNLIHSARILAKFDEHAALQQAMAVYSVAETINSHRFTTEAMNLIRQLEVGKYLEVESDIEPKASEAQVKVIIHLVSDPKGETNIAFSDYRSSSQATRDLNISPNDMKGLFMSGDTELFCELPWPSAEAEQILSEMADQTLPNPITIRMVEKQYDPELIIVHAEELIPLSLFRQEDFVANLKSGIRLKKEEWMPLIDFAISERRSVWAITTLLSYFKREEEGFEEALNDTEKLIAIKALASVVTNSGIPSETVRLVGTTLQHLCSQFLDDHSTLGPEAEKVVINGKAISDEILGDFHNAYAGYAQSLGGLLLNRSLDANAFTKRSFLSVSNQLNRALRCIANSGINSTTYSRFTTLYGTCERARNLHTQIQYFESKGIDGSKHIQSFQSKNDIVEEGEVYFQLSLVQRFFRGQGFWHRCYVLPGCEPQFDRVDWNYAYGLFQAMYKSFTSDEFLISGGRGNLEEQISSFARLLNNLFERFNSHDDLKTVLVNPQSYISNIPWGLLASVWEGKNPVTAVQCFSLNSYQAARSVEREHQKKLPKRSIFLDPKVAEQSGLRELPGYTHKYSSDAFVTSINEGGLTVYLGHGSVYLDEESSHLVFSSDDRMNLKTLEDRLDPINSELSVVIILGCWAGTMNMTTSLALLNSMGLPSSLKAAGVDYIIASPWPVSLELAACFTRKFLNFRNLGEDVVSAFRQSYHGLLNEYGFEKVFREAPGIQLYA